MTLDNDLLTLWLHAGDLTREEVRALVEDKQRLRVEVVTAKADDADDREDYIKQLEQRLDEAEARAEDLEMEIRELEGRIEGLEAAP